MEVLSGNRLQEVLTTGTERKGHVFQCLFPSTTRVSAQSIRELQTVSQKATVDSAPMSELLLQACYT